MKKILVVTFILVLTSAYGNSGMVGMSGVGANPWMEMPSYDDLSKEDKYTFDNLILHIKGNKKITPDLKTSLRTNNFLSTP